ncbi:NAD(P)/FAD-dependent oxidoreductase [Nocardia beijingensis]
MTVEHIVIAGAGHAGMQLADTVRARGNRTPITLVSDEPGLPYQRPPLSKDYLTPNGNPQRLPLKSPRFFADNNVTLVDGDPIVRIDRGGRSVRLSSGADIGYSKLVLATGARARALDVPGTASDGVHYLRTAADATRLHAALSHARSAVVVGAGFIGLEFAAVANTHGLDVTVLECGVRPMARALSDRMSRFFADAHASAGIRFAFNEAVTAIESDGTRVAAVLGSSGARYPADLVIVGIGVEPNVEVAAAAGLVTTDGVDVDSYLQTSDDSIWAVGDCAYFPCGHAGATIRRESVQNAVDQARTLARTLNGTPTRYHELPWFWSHQGTLKLQIAGLVGEPDYTAVQGDPASGKFSVFCFRDEILTCVETVNNPGVHIAARKFLTAEPSVTLEDLAGVGFDLKSLAKHGSAA